MGGRETGWYRTESGAVLEMDHPLQDGIAHRVKTGEIVRVVKDPDRDRWVPWEPSAALPEVSADEAAANRADLHAALAAALDRVAELETALAAVTKERDELRQAVVELKPAPEPAPKTGKGKAPQ